MSAQISSVCAILTIAPVFGVGMHSIPANVEILNFNSFFVKKGYVIEILLKIRELSITINI